LRHLRHCDDIGAGRGWFPVIARPVRAKLPAAVVVKVVTREGVRLVIVACPYCHREHVHGWPPEYADPGVRLAHCHRPNGEPARSYRVHVAVSGGVR